MARISPGAQECQGDGQNAGARADIERRESACRDESATASRNSMQPRVVAWVPVPKAMPGSMVITWRRRNFGGVKPRWRHPKRFPTRRGLMKRFQECCQFSCRMIFQRSRGLPASATGG